MTDTKMFSTSDFYVAAVLIAKKHAVETVTSEGSKKKFHFADSEELRATVMKYINGTITGNLRDFRNAIEVVKDLIHQ